MLINVKRVALISICVSSIFVFATSSFAAVVARDASKILAPNLENGIYVDEVNYGLQKLKSHMSDIDYAYAVTYVSNYRRNVDGAEEGLRAIVSKYITSDNVDLVLDYVLRYNDVEHLGQFKVDKTTNTPVFTPIKNFTEVAGSGAMASAVVYWNMMSVFAPLEFIDCVVDFNIDNNRDTNEYVLFKIKDDLATKFELCVDQSICPEAKINTLVENIIYLTAYYYAFNVTQVDFAAPANSTNYKFEGFTYADNSAVNAFYKRYWSDNKVEIHSNQYPTYNKEFINPKASYSVYDDMAVSFYNYVYNNNVYTATGRKYFWYKSDKISFFRNFGTFVAAANELRAKLNIG